MKKPHDIRSQIQALVSEGPCRGLIRDVSRETGKKYMTVRWHIVESKKRNPLRDRFFELAGCRAAENAEQSERIEQIKIQLDGTQAKAS